MCIRDSSEPVEAFHCSLGAGGGVYALAVTATSCVFLRDRAMAKRSDVEPHLGDAGWAGAYGVLYDRKPPRSPLRDVKLISGNRLGLDHRRETIGKRLGGLSNLPGLHVVEP